MSAGPATAVTAYVGLGANLGDPLLQLRRAIAALAQLPDTSVTAQSSLFRSAPVDAGGDDYVNAVVQLTTRLPAAELLAHLQALEQAGGRERPYRNAPRTLDLDILLYGQQQIASEQLTIPHPRLTQRAFALIPLLQLDPLLAIPGQGPAHSFAPAVAAQAIQKIGDEY
jgi:2-amino-4-hydroxy-6-hydroxymethyldihydropteridine diphosphokinase